MSDFSFDDSFDSASGSDEAEAQDEYGLQPVVVGGSLPVYSSMFTGSLPVSSPSKKELAGGSVVVKGMFDVEFHDDWRSKEERSPKPKKKFGSNFGSSLRKSTIGSIRRTKMSDIKQKIKSKLRRDLPIFGAPLEAAIQRSLLGADGIELPTVFRECISYLEDNWLDQEGLYRLPGVKSKIEDAKTRYDRGEVVDLDDYDPNVVASLLKLYLRELPEPLINTSMRLESLAGLPLDEQSRIILEELEGVPSPNKLMLSWLLEHISHIIQHSAVNKMSLPNLVIVFSPTLQLSATLLHTLYNNCRAVFGDIELAKYKKPVIEKKVGRLKLPNLKESEGMSTEVEITAELDKLTAVLEKLHSKIAGKYDERNDYFWELQRTITLLRRKRKNLLASNNNNSMSEEVVSQVMPNAGGEEEFIKTLELMEATLMAENEELMSKKEKLQASIRQETQLIDNYKQQLEEQRARLQDDFEEESEDVSELANEVATLKWHGKELEMRNLNLVKSIEEEEKEILQLKVKLKDIPLKQKLDK